MKISIIHPSRHRAAQANRTANKWISSAKHPDKVEYILACDNSDIHLDAYAAQFTGDRFIKVFGDHQSAIEAINNAATRATGDLIMVVSDDFDCPFHWDFALTKLLQGRTDFVVKTDDGLQPFIITLPIMDRVYYENQGYIYHPDYQHMYSDSHMSCKAFLEGKYINLPIRFPHHHYSTGRNKKDEVNVKADSTYESGRLTFLKHYQDNFGVNDIKQHLPASSGFVNFG